MKTFSTLLVAILCMLCTLIVSSCSRHTNEPYVKKETAVNLEHTKLINSYFTDILKGHKVTNIEESETGIYLPDSRVGLKGRVNQLKDLGNGSKIAELELKITLPDERTVDEFLANATTTTKDSEAIKKVLDNFTLTTFHPIYAAFIDNKDPHVIREKWTINGVERDLYRGDCLEMVYQAKDSKIKPDPHQTFNDWWLARFKEALAARKLNDDDHWIKFFIAVQNGKLLENTALIDNNPDPDLMEYFKNLKELKSAGELYTIKEFLVVKHVDKH